MIGRILCAALLLGAGLTNVRAAAPTIEQSRQAAALFGFDTFMPRVLDDALNAKAPAAWTQTQRVCVRDAALPLFQRAMDTQFATMFESGENVDAWMAFSHTAGGAHMIDLLRQVVASAASGASPPNLDAALNGMSESQKKDIERFAGTPAGAIMKKRFPKAPEALAGVAAARGAILTSCGIVAND